MPELWFLMRLCLISYIIKMGDADYEKEYSDRKKRLKSLHKKLNNPESKRIQEIYHKIMGSAEGDANSSDSKSDSDE